MFRLSAVRLAKSSQIYASETSLSTYVWTQNVIKPTYPLYLEFKDNGDAARIPRSI